MSRVRSKWFGPRALGLHVALLAWIGDVRRRRVVAGRPRDLGQLAQLHVRRRVAGLRRPRRPRLVRALAHGAGRPSASEAARREYEERMRAEAAAARAAAAARDDEDPASRPTTTTSAQPGDQAQEEALGTLWSAAFRRYRMMSFVTGTTLLILCAFLALHTWSTSRCGSTLKVAGDGRRASATASCSTRSTWSMCFQFWLKTRIPVRAARADAPGRVRAGAGLLHGAPRCACGSSPMAPSSRDWLERRVIAYAHQGGSFEGPSSTLCAIGARAGRRRDGDRARRARDAATVTSSSATTRRSTARPNHSRGDRDLTLAELRAMDNAYWWIEGETVTPGRADATSTCCAGAPRPTGARRRHARRGGRGLPRRPAEPGHQAHRAGRRALRGAAGRRAAPASARATTVIVASFLDDAIAAIPGARPRGRDVGRDRRGRGVLLSVLEGSPSPCRRCAPSRCPATFGDVTVVDERFVDAAHAAGVAVHVWTINDPRRWRRLLDLGVDGIISDRPSVAGRGRCERRGLRLGRAL